MRHPGQCKSLSAQILPVVEPVSHIMLEYWLVLNAFRNLGPKDSGGVWPLQRKALLNLLQRGDFKESSSRPRAQMPSWLTPVE